MKLSKIFAICFLFLNAQFFAMKRSHRVHNHDVVKKVRKNEKKYTYKGSLTYHNFFEFEIPELFALCVDEKPVIQSGEEELTEQLKNKKIEHDKNILRISHLLDTEKVDLIYQPSKRSVITILHALAYNENPEKKEALELIERRLQTKEGKGLLKAMLCCPDGQGNLPLHIAVKKLNIEAAKFFIKHGAKEGVLELQLNYLNDRYQTIFVGRDHEYARSCQFDPNRLFGSASSPTITTKHIEMLELLLYAGINLNKVRDNSIMRKACAWCKNFSNFLDNLKIMQQDHQKTIQTLTKVYNDKNNLMVWLPSELKNELTHFIIEPFIINKETMLPPKEKIPIIENEVIQDLDPLFTDYDSDATNLYADDVMSDEEIIF